MSSGEVNEEFFRKIWASIASNLLEEDDPKNWSEMMGHSNAQKETISSTVASNGICPSLRFSSTSSGSPASSLECPILSEQEDFSLFNYNRLHFNVEEDFKPRNEFDMPSASSSASTTCSNVEQLLPYPEGGSSSSQHKDVNSEINSLTEATNYEIVQRNGQRIYGGPPPHWVGPPPEKGAEIFVGKVPRDCFENELVPLFSSVGIIYELRLMMDFSGSNRGYLFVKYTSSSEANLAIQKLNNHEIRPGKHIGVCRSVDNRKLWISGLPKNRSIEDIKADLEKKTPGVTDIITYPSHTDKSRSRSYAFVEYENHRAAALARRKLVPGRIFILDHEIEKVDWAQPEVEVEDEIMNKVQNLFVRNISPLTSANKIGELFESLSGGKLEHVSKDKDHAFVHFSSRKSAETALSRAQKLIVDGCPLDVSWARPVNRLIYNTRKELTKILSSGSMTNELSTLDSLNGGMNPFRGAPGTTPPRSLTKMLNAKTSGRPSKGFDRFYSGQLSELEPRMLQTDLLHQFYDIDVGSADDYRQRQAAIKSNHFYGTGYSGLTPNGGILPSYTYGYQPLPPFLGRYSVPSPYNSIVALSSTQAMDPISLSMYHMSLN